MYITLFRQNRPSNDEDFKGTITYSEARDEIFVGALGLDISILHSLKFGFINCRTVTYKLKKQINIDDLTRAAKFSFKRKVWSGETEVSDELHCKLLGVRTPITAIQSFQSETGVRRLDGLNLESVVYV